MISFYILSLIIYFICLSKKINVVKRCKENAGIIEKYNVYSYIPIIADILIIIFVDLLKEGGINPDPDNVGILRLSSFSMIFGFLTWAFIAVVDFVLWKRCKNYIRGTETYKKGMYIYGAIMGIPVGWIKMIFTVTVLGNLQINMVTHALE